MSDPVTSSDVEDWDIENVVAYLKVLEVSADVIDAFHGIYFIDF